MNLHATEPAVTALRPGEDAYGAAVRGFFGTGDPRMVVRPHDHEEVAAALAYAARHELGVSVRSGGHGPLGVGAGGMLIDVSRLDAIQVLDAERRIVRVGAGATWGRVAVALDAHGWGLTAGDSAGVGVGGLTLGGGIGWMVRRHGLAIDNLVGARLVTADGRLLTASAGEHPELFWALRGGGGNFGVVIDLDFIAQPVGTVHFASITYRMDDAVGLISRWRDAMRAAPEQLSSTLALAPRRPGAPAVATVLACYAGERGCSAEDAEHSDSDGHSDADAAIEPLLELGTVTAASITERRYCDILEDAPSLPGFRLVPRNTLVPALDDDVIAELARLHGAPEPKAITVRSLGGAFGRVAPGATAFAHRDAEAMIVCFHLLAERASDADVARALGPWRSVAARGTGTYLNFQGSATAADIAAAYPPATYARLVDVKRAYDPRNRFAANHNIAPTARLVHADGPAA